MNEDKCSQDAIQQKILRCFSSLGVGMAALRQHSPSLRFVCQSAKDFDEIDKQNYFPLSVQMPLLLLIRKIERKYRIERKPPHIWNVYINICAKVGYFINIARLTSKIWNKNVPSLHWNFILWNFISFVSKYSAIVLDEKLFI